MVGRKKEIDDLVRLLKTPGVGLVTLHGLGGTGKTRLAVETGKAALDLFPAGVWFVGLAPLSSPEHIITATASAIGFAFQTSENQQRQLTQFLTGKKLLLIFDNLEHLLPEVSVYLEEILENVPECRLLVTSRELMNTSWEWAYALHGLDYEPSTAQGQSETPDAIQFFLQQLKRRGMPDAESDLICATKICKSVNGLPLALLLAASWAPTLECDEILQEIQQGSGFLQARQNTFPEKHKSMQAVFDYSWRLLGEHERAPLRKLVVFPGEFDRNAAIEVAAANLTLVATLVDKSLIERVAKDRYQIHELLRQYLKERLTEAGEEKLARDQHLDYYTQVAKQAERELVGEQLDKWIRWFTLEIDSIRAALEWSLDQREISGLSKGLSLMLHLTRLWQLHNYLKEGLSYLNRFLAALPNELKPRLYAEGLNLASDLSFRIRAYAESRRLAAEVMQIGLTLNDHYLLADAYYCQGSDAFMQNDFTTSHSLAQQALESYKKVESPLKSALALNLIGNIEFYLGSLQEAYKHQLEALEIVRKLKDEISIATILHSLAELAAVDPSLGLERSRKWIEEGLRYARKLNDITLVQILLMDLAEGLRQEGRYADAVVIYEEIIRTINEAVPKEEYIIIWLNLGFAYFRIGKHTRGKQIFLDNLVEIQRSNRNVYNELPHCLLGLARAEVAEGRAPLAARILGALEAHKASLVFWPTDKSEYEGIYAAVKAQLAENLFDQLMIEGQALSLSEATQLIQRQESKEERSSDERLNQLTKREIEILRLVAQGLSDVQIADRLVLSSRTVNAHLTSVYRKLGINSRSAATRFAIEHGLA